MLKKDFRKEMEPNSAPYMQRIQEYFNGLANQVIDFCNTTHKEYHIKTGTITETTKL